MKYTRRHFVAMLGAAGAALTLRSVPAQAITAYVDCVEPKEAEVVQILNDIRAQYGLGSLMISDTLSASAEHWGQAMSHHNWFAHVAPDGTTWADNQRNHGYTYNTYRGQNIGAVVETAQAMVNAWMDSEGHRDNILNPHYTAIGVDYSKIDGSQYTRYWVTDFGGYRDAEADYC